MSGSKLPQWQRDLVLKLLRMGLPASHAAEEAGVATPTALGIARAHGVPVRPRGGGYGRPPTNRKPPETREKALRFIRKGSTLREAGAAAGVSHETVNLWVQSEGVVLKRSDANFAKLRRRALRMSRAGVPDRVINEKLGVTAATFWRLAAGIPAAGRVQCSNGA